MGALEGPGASPGALARSCHYSALWAAAPDKGPAEPVPAVSHCHTRNLAHDRSATCSAFRQIYRWTMENVERKRSPRLLASLIAGARHPESAQQWSFG